MKKILLSLFLVFSFVVLFGLGSVLPVQAEDGLPMTGTLTKVKLSTVNNVKVTIYKSITSPEGTITDLLPLCQYMTFTSGVKNLNQCSTYIGNDSQGLVVVAFSNHESGAVIGSVYVNDDAYQFSDLMTEEVVTLSTVASGISTFSTSQIVSELTNGNLPSGVSILAQNGDDPMGWMPYSDMSAWVKVGLPIPGELGHYKIYKITNSGAPLVYTAPTIELKANNSVGPVNLASSTTPVTLTWNVTGSSSCTASTVATPTNSGAASIWTGSKTPSGTFPIGVSLVSSTSYQFKLNCVSSGGTPSSKTVVVNVPAAPLSASVSFTNSSVAVQTGTPATLSFTPVNAGSCTVASVGTPVGPVGTTTGNTWSGTFTSVGNYTYQVNCIANANAAPANPTATATVTVTPAPLSASVSFTNSSVAVQTGTPATLSFTPVNAGSCTVASVGTPVGPVGTTTGNTWSGTFTSVGNYTYQVNCTAVLNATPATVTDTVTVTATATTPQNPSVIVKVNNSLNANISVGESATLTWDSFNVDNNSCVKSGGTSGWSSVSGASGGLLGWSTGPVQNVGTYTYIMTCANPNGTAVATGSATLTVSLVTPPPSNPTVTITANPTTTPIGGTSTITWSSTNANSCSMSGGTTGWSAASGANGTFTTPTLNAAGTLKFDITCIGATGTTPATGSATVTVTKKLQPLSPTVTITANPASVPVGGTSTITWSANNALSCAKSGGVGSWTTGTQTSGTFTTPALNAAGPVKFNITCVGAVGTNPATDFTTVNVTDSPVVNLKVNNLSQHNVTVNNPGITLSWSSINTTANCTASTSINTGGASTSSTLWSGIQPSTGSVLKTLSTGKVYTFTLACTGNNGAAASDAVTVTYVKPPTVDLKVKVGNGASTDGPVTTPSNASMKLVWSSTDTTTCNATTTEQPSVTGSLWSGKKTPNGTSASITGLVPSTTYTFTLTCNGSQGTASDNVTVSVELPPAPTVTITANPASVPVGGTSTITWSANNALSCAKSGGVGSWTTGTQTSGTFTTPALNAAGVYTFNISCAGPNGTTPATGFATVTVIAPPSPTVTISASPTNVVVGDKSTITWSSTNALACTMTNGTKGWPTATGTSGTFTTLALNDAGTFNFNISCAGSNGTTPATASVAVVVTRTVSSLPPTVTINANPTTVVVGGKTTITWSSAHATSCDMEGGSTGWKLLSGTAGTFTSTALNSVGSITYKISCNGVFGTTPAKGTVVVSVIPVPSVPTVTITASPSIVVPGGKTTINLSSVGSTSCVRSGGSVGWPGAPGATGGSWLSGPLNNEGVLNYSATCTGPGGIKSAFVTVVVSQPAPQVFLTINPSHVPDRGNATVNWSTINATSCTRNGNWWSGPTSLNGSFGTGIIHENRVYGLVCSGPGGTTSASAQITVGQSVPLPAPEVTISATPTNAIIGGTIKITSTAGPTVQSCVRSGGHTGWPSVPGVGGTWTSGVLTTLGATTYTITCKDAYNMSNTASVTVYVNDPPKPTLTLSANPKSVIEGNTTKITWSSANSASCTGSWSNNPLQLTGNWTSPKLYENTTYSVTCKNSGNAQVTKSITITVN